MRPQRNSVSLRTHQTLRFAQCLFARTARLLPRDHLVAPRSFTPSATIPSTLARIPCFFD